MGNFYVTEPGTKRINCEIEELRRMIKKEITFENKKLSELVDYLDIYVKHEIENDNNLKPEEKRGRLISSNSKMGRE